MTFVCSGPSRWCIKYVQLCMPECFYACRAMAGKKTSNIVPLASTKTVQLDYLQQIMAKLPCATPEWHPDGHFVMMKGVQKQFAEQITTKSLLSRQS